MKNLLGTTTPATGPGSLYASYHFWPGTVSWFLAAAIALVVLGLIFSLSWRRLWPSLVAIILSGGILGFLFWLQTRGPTVPIVFSDRAMLNELWAAYRGEYLEPGTGRTLDKQRANISTSEGEGYTMLRAVWVDDKATFDQSWQWTKNNLERPDHLFSWLFGELPSGRYGILTNQGGMNTASDADTDIAVALLFAYYRWQDPNYLAAALKIIPQIWETEVVTVRGRPYLAANNVEKQTTGSTILINPSYFSPYAYRMFAAVDRSHPWLDLVGTSYDLIDQSVSDPLNQNQSAGLPPDWVTINRQSGALAASADTRLSTNFGYDALRLPWRLTLDYQWYQEPRAVSTLAKLHFLSDEWQQKRRLGSTYAHNGQALLNYESPAIYGGTLGYFMLTDPVAARQIYREKLISLYDPDTTRWKSILTYYDDNLAWFGLALYQGDLYNLSLSRPH